MKKVLVTALLASFGLLCCGELSPADAQTMYDCQSVAKPKDRLACYDKLSPPIAAKDKRAPSTSTDLDKEDARMKALLKPICRNC